MGRLRFLITAFALIAGCASLAAQGASAKTTVHIPQVQGEGKEPSDNSFVSLVLARELESRGYVTNGNLKKSTYQISGTIASLPDEAFSLRLTLLENATQKLLGEQTLIYATREELENLIAVMSAHIFADIPAETSLNIHAWREKRFYFGAAVSWTPRIYFGSSESTIIPNFGGGLFGEWRPLKIFALGIGAEAAPDYLSLSAGSGDNYWDAVLSIPLSIRLVLTPGSFSMIEIYAGAAGNFSLYHETEPFIVSLMAGVQYGVKAGPGVFFLEPRFSMDMGNSIVETRQNKKLEYQRYIIYMGIGYKFGVKD